MNDVYTQFANANLPFFWIVFTALGLIFIFILMPCILKFAHEKKLMAIPFNSSLYKDAIPNLGGVAIFIGVIVLQLYCILF